MWQAFLSGRSVTAGFMPTGLVKTLSAWNSGLISKIGEMRWQEFWGWAVCS